MAYPKNPGDPQEFLQTPTGPIAGVAPFYWSGTTWLPTPAPAGGAASPVVLASRASKAVTTLARPADVIAYAAGDVVTAARTFANPASTGEFLIISASLRIDRPTIIAGETGYRLALNWIPAVVIADNAPFSLPAGDRNGFQGVIEFGTLVETGGVIYAEANGINKQISITGANTSGYLITNGAHTPESGTSYTLTLRGMLI